MTILAAPDWTAIVLRVVVPTPVFAEEPGGILPGHTPAIVVAITLKYYTPFTLLVGLPDSTMRAKHELLFGSFGGNSWFDY